MGPPINTLQSQHIEALTKINNFEKEIKSIKDQTQSEIKKKFQEMKFTPTPQVAESLTIVIGNIEGQTVSSKQGGP